ncbi:MAG: transposase [Methylococcaceae bacterium]|nr:transposase [Methylococcaceae bacterium]
MGVGYPAYRPFDRLRTGFLFGVAGNSILSPLARPFLQAAHQLHETRCAYARLNGQKEPEATRTYHDLNYSAKTWPKTFHMVLKAEVMALGENPRFVVTSLDLPGAESLYRDLYCARGQDDKSAGQPICTHSARRVRYRDIPHDYWIKVIKNDLASDRTSDHRFLANHLRLFFSCAATVLHHALRTEVRVHIELAKAQPFMGLAETVQNRRAGRSIQGPRQTHLPSRCPVKPLRVKICGILFQTPEPVLNTA